MQKGLFDGLSSSEKPVSHKGNLGKRRLTEHLEATSTGLVPANDEPRPYKANYNAKMRNKKSEEIQMFHTRRHIDPHHVDFSDEAKRAEGRCGTAKVLTNEQRRREEAYYDSPIKNSVPQPPGQENNLYLKSYYYTPVPAAPKPNRSDLSASANPQATSVQLAEARLKQIEAEHPRYKTKVEAVLKTSSGDVSIVEKENELQKRLQREMYAQGSRKRVEEIQKTTKYHGRPDLGSPNPTLEKTVPYALNFSGPRSDSASLAKPGLRITHNHNEESRPVTTKPREVDRTLYDGPKPYDSVNVSGVAYPAPPEVGVSRSIWQKPSLVRHSSLHHKTCNEDRDTLALKRARQRQASQSQDRPDFIFGTPKGDSTPSRSLRHQTEKRWKQQENQAFERRTGKAHVGPAYKDTSLW